MSIRRVFVVAACALALSACSSPANPTASPSASGSAAPSPSSTVPVQNNLDGISVSGAWLKKPKVTFKAPFFIDETRSKVLIQGKGNEITDTSLFTIRYYLANGRTGEVEETYSDGAEFTTALNGLVPGFAGLKGVKEGSRVLLAIAGPDSYDGVDPGSRPTDYQDGDTLIFVVDITGVSDPQPEGATVTPAVGLPTVTGDAASKPVVTIPATDPPKAMKTQVLIKGTGPKVTKKDIVYSRYVGYSWKTGGLIDDKFDAPEATPLDVTLPGIKAGLVGQTVGSRVLLVLPPKDGFPLGSNNPPVEAGDTVVYVVDILYAYQQ